MGPSFLLINTIMQLEDGDKCFPGDIVNLRVLAQPARNSLPVFKFNPSSSA